MRRGIRVPPGDLAPRLFTPPSEPAPIPWKDIFNNDAPVVLEVGFGKGLFLITQSQRQPELNFFGIEIDRPCQLYTATRLVKRDITNVRLACANAQAYLRHYVPPHSVSAVHVYFPDPWWKNKHRKRRLVNEEFVKLVQQILLPGGKFHLATDVEKYFKVMVKLIKENTSFVELPPPVENSPEHDLDYLTNFERKFRKQGLPIYRAEYSVSETSNTR